MSTHGVLDFTVTDLLGGGDVVRLVAAEDPDTVWGEVIGWPRHRLTAALVAAVGVIQNERPDEAAAGHSHDSSADGDGPAGQHAEWTPADGR